MNDFEQMQISMGLKDVPNQQYIDLDNGNKLNLTRRDPFGFIYLSLDKGQLPATLAGSAFTDWAQAKIAALAYVKERQETVAELKECVAGGKIKFERKLKD